MASGPIASWQIEREKVEAVTDFLLLCSKITTDGDCSHEIRRYLLLGGKAMTNLDSVLKGRDITLPIYVSIVKAMVFPVVTYGCKSWTIKKAKSQRIDAFKLWCWRRLLSPLDSKEIKPVNLKGNQPWILIQRTDTETEAPTFCSPDVNSWLSCKVPDAWKDWRQEKKASRGLDGWVTSLMQWTWTWANLERWEGTGRPGVLQSMGSQRSGHNWGTEQQHNVNAGN